MSSILVETATAIAEALTANAFDYGDFAADWDYEHRLKDADLIADQLDVRVIIPRKVDEATRSSRSEVRYAAGYDVDVRFKFGSSDSPTTMKDSLAALSSLVEDIHQFFFDNPILGNDENLEWCGPDNELGLESKILVAYSSKHLREQRMFYAVCREYFWKTR